MDFTQPSVLGRRWKLLDAGEGSLHERLLRQRNIPDPEAFFAPDYTRDGHDAASMRSMSAAVERVLAAVDEGECILVFGDYDVDGLTGATILAETLEYLGGDARVRVPHRLDEGYGLSVKAVEEAAAAGVRLLVTADCGVANAVEIAAAKERGIDTVVCDHHTLPEVLPEAAAVLHPKQEGCGYPFKELTGAGVAYKLAQALVRARRPGEDGEAFLLGLLDLAALGTVADMGPLLGENRMIVAVGLEELAARRRPGLAALLASAGVDAKELTTETIGFKLGPRLNAAGRMDSPDVALQLLRTKDPLMAQMLAARLEELNVLRQQRTTEIMVAIGERMKADDGAPAIILADASWSIGLLGLLASRVVDGWHRPAVLLEDRGDHLVGSARSIPGLDVFAALDACRDLFLKFGGHAQAAGLSITHERFPEFRERFNAAVSAQAVAHPELVLDAVLSSDECCLESVALLRAFQPFGVGNTEPIFLLRDAAVVQARTVGADRRHLRIECRHGGRNLALIAFGWGDRAAEFRLGRPFSAAVRIGASEWNGRPSLDVKVEDVRF